MFGVGLYTSSALLFILVIAALLFRDRKNVRRESGIMFLRRTQRGKKFLYRIGNSRPRLWKMLGNLAVVAGFLVSVWFVWVMLAQLPLLASGAVPKESGGGLLLPSLSEEASMGRGFILVPFWYWIISIFVILFVHEGMHAMLGITAKVRIKSIGWGLLAVLPLGFVEPDERQVEKKRHMEQLRFFAAGSFGNFVAAAASLAVLAFVLNPMVASNGVYYRALAIGYPADAANMTGYIINVGGYAVNSTAGLGSVLETIGPNKTVVVTTVNVTPGGSDELGYVLETAPEPAPAFKPDAFTGIAATFESAIPGVIDFFGRPPWDTSERLWADVEYDMAKWQYLGASYPALSRRASEKVAEFEADLSKTRRKGYLGIANAGNVQAVRPEFAGYSESITFFGGLFFWLFLLNFGVGAFNLLPMKPLDGERMWRIVVQRIYQRRSRTRGIRGTAAKLLRKDDSARKASRFMDYVSIAVLFIILAFFAIVVA